MIELGMVVLLIVDLYLVIVGVSRYRGRSLGAKVVKLLERKDAEWQRKGMSEEHIKKHLKYCIEAIEQLKLSHYKQREILVLCKRILDNEEKYMIFEADLVRVVKPGEWCLVFDGEIRKRDR